MSYDEKLAARVRAQLRKQLGGRSDVVEKTMFGGLCFMVGGAMCCGLTRDDFMVRVGPAQFEEALAEAHARPMDFTGRPSKGMVYVAPEGLRTEAGLGRWIQRGLVFVSTAPPRPPKRRKRPSSA